MKLWSVGLVALLLAAVQPVSSQWGEDSNDGLKERIDRFVDRVLSATKGDFPRFLFKESDFGPGFLDDDAIPSADTVSPATLVVSSDTTIAVGDTVSASLLVTGCKLTLLGKIVGNVEVNNGTFRMEPGSSVEGNILLVNSEFRRLSSTSISGTVTERVGKYTAARRSHDTYRSRYSRVHYPRYALDWDNGMLHGSDAIFRYDRVNGLLLGLGHEKQFYWDGVQQHSPHGFLGYGFAVHRWQYQLGWDLWSGNLNRFELGGDYHYGIDTKDSWLIGDGENTAAAILFRQDFRDYFGRKGFSVHAAQYFSPQIRLQVSYGSDKYESLPQETNWSVFRPDHHFRMNPAIDDGSLKSVSGQVDIATYDENRRGEGGWRIRVTGEYAGDKAPKDLGGDFSFTQCTADVRRYQPIADWGELRLRGRGGRTIGDAPRQRIYELGGIGSLPAFPFKAYSGSDMFLGNAELILNGTILRELPVVSWFTHDLAIILFGDAGKVSGKTFILCYPGSEEGLMSGFSFENGTEGWKSDLGIGVGSRSGNVRLLFAWRTDIPSPAKIIFRISQSF